MYYPVSALVTLFANVLQNPQDPRARSDLRLMNVVVEFLQTVQKEDDSNRQDSGSVQRMLTVCGEFHRIAKLVLDKAESESVNRRKRKNEEARQSVSYPHKHNASSSPTRTSMPQTPSPMAETASPPTSILNPEINSQVPLTPLLLRLLGYYFSSRSLLADSPTKISYLETIHPRFRPRIHYLG